MSKDYEPSPTLIASLIARLEEENERLLFIVSVAIKMRVAQEAYFKVRSKDNLIASKIREAEFDKMAKAMMEGRT
jgi:hypothetical protein